MHTHAKFVLIDLLKQAISLLFAKRDMRYSNLACLKTLTHLIFIPHFSTRPVSQPLLLDTVLPLPGTNPTPNPKQ